MSANFGLWIGNAFALGEGSASPPEWPAWVAAGLWAVHGLALLALLAICTLTDLRDLKIYNRVTYRFLVLMLMLAAVSDLLALPPVSLPWQSVPPHLLRESGWGGASALSQSCWGGLLCGLALPPLWLTTGRGGGDVKLAVVIGTAVGPELGLLAIGWTFLVGGVLTLGWLMWRLGPLTAVVFPLRQVLGSVWPRVISPPPPEQRQVFHRPVPLAGFFALGTLLALGGAA